MEPGTFEAQFWPSWRTQRHQLGVCGPWILDGGPNPDQCWDFLKHYKNAEVQAGLGYFNPVPATTPSRRSLNTEERWGPTGVKNWRIFYDTIDERPDTGPIAQPVFVVELTNIFTRYTSLATNGEQTPQEALDNMQAEMEGSLRAQRVRVFWRNHTGWRPGLALTPQPPFPAQSREPFRERGFNFNARHSFSWRVVT